MIIAAFLAWKYNEIIAIKYLYFKFDSYPKTNRLLINSFLQSRFQFSVVQKSEEENGQIIGYYVSENILNDLPFSTEKTG